MRRCDIAEAGAKPNVPSRGKTPAGDRPSPSRLCGSSAAPRESAPHARPDAPTTTGTAAPTRRHGALTLARVYRRSVPEVVSHDGVTTSTSWRADAGTAP